MQGKRERTSIFWTIPDEEFIDLIKKAKRWRDVLDHFGLESMGGNYYTIKERVDHLGLSTDHFMRRLESSSLSRKMTVDKLKSEWLTENSSKNRGHLKNYLIKFELIPYSCEKCGLEDSWQGEPITLQIEHKNGIPNDNRLENLCFLCPNCHSQTSTYAGKKNGKPSKNRT